MQNNLCLMCANYLSQGKCKAFSDGIPEVILIGYNNHQQPLPDQQNDIVFTPIENING